MYLEEEESARNVVEAARRRIRANLSLIVLESWEDAKAFLRGKGVYANTAKYPYPDVVLVGMPSASGKLFLRWRRRDPGARGTVLAAVDGKWDGAAGGSVARVFPKPRTVEQFLRIVDTIGALGPGLRSRERLPSIR